MPRAVEQAEKIMEELAAVRESIEALSERLLQVSSIIRLPSVICHELSSVEQPRPFRATDGCQIHGKRGGATYPGVTIRDSRTS